MFKRTRRYARVFTRASIASLKFDLHLLDCMVNKINISDDVAAELVAANCEWIKLTWPFTNFVWDLVLPKEPNTNDESA